MSLVIPQHKSCVRSELITKDQQLTMNMAGTCQSKVGPIPSICSNWHLSTDTNSPTTYIKTLKKNRTYCSNKNRHKNISHTFQDHVENISKTIRQTTKNHTQKPSTKKIKGKITQTQTTKGAPPGDGVSFPCGLAGFPQSRGRGGPCLGIYSIHVTIGLYITSFHLTAF